MGPRGLCQDGENRRRPIVTIQTHQTSDCERNLQLSDPSALHPCDAIARFPPELWGGVVVFPFRFLAYFCFVALAGCATPYQSMGFMGGVEAHQMTKNTFRIVARGNGYTAGTTIQDYAILKAAETTRQAGGTHFAVISASDASSVGHVTTPGQARTSVIGSTAYTT
jgi:hypothetical protein